MNKFRKTLGLIFLVSAIVTYFAKSHFKSVTQIVPASLYPPQQTEASSKLPINFSNNGYEYQLEPMYDYVMTGLVVHTLQYDKWFSLSRTDDVFSVDWCVFWGSNLQSGAYKEPSLKVSQDARFCRLQYDSGAILSDSEFSNSHLVVIDPAVESAVKKVSAGDQIRLSGKLVNVTARAQGSTSKYELKEERWQTSVSRSDTGMGACEVIYVESVEILKKGNVLSHQLFDISKYGLGLVVVWTVVGFFASVPKIRRPRERQMIE